ncbi:MAG: tRNA (guanine-N1)-methyltransferase [Patescibacteria group bacterium]|jgi:tRNA (guanine37-N1)-methyltransferase|nr:tRNA (guanine-N1)-methyltransferase [Patescibacteria group bacterium]
MRFDVLTLFPEIIQGSLEASILKRAQNKGLLEVHFHNIRDAASDKHKMVDDTPYGGGAGMVLKVDVVDAALQQVLQLPELQQIDPSRRKIIMLTPQGVRFRQSIAKQLATDYEHIIFLCGHYEGFDERIRSLVDAELSIGDFVLTGGELPAAMVIDAISRLLPEVIREESPEEESFGLTDEKGNLLLEYPHYTRPLEYNGQKVPDVLLSGNHAAIKAWRLEQAKLKTTKRQESNETL